MSTYAGRRRELSPVVVAAQRVAGLVAARGRGDADGARRLLGDFNSSEELAGGALLVAELALTLLSDERNVHLDHCVQELCAHLENALDN